MASYDHSSNHELMSMMRDVMIKLDSVSEDVRHLSYRLSQMEKNMAAPVTARPDQRSTPTPNQDLEQIRGSIATAVAFTNCFNVVFYGIQQRHGMSVEDIFRNFMIEMLRISQEKAYTMPVHVQYLPRMSRLDLTIPICVTFRSQDDRGYVCDKATKYKKILEAGGIRAEGQYNRIPNIWKTSSP